jgi:hypothetical protein
VVTLLSPASGGVASRDDSGFNTDKGKVGRVDDGYHKRDVANSKSGSTGSEEYRGEGGESVRQESRRLLSPSK